MDSKSDKLRKLQQNNHDDKKPIDRKLCNSDPASANVVVHGRLPSLLEDDAPSVVPTVPLNATVEPFHRAMNPGPLSYVSLSWLNYLMRLGYKRPLGKDDLPELSGNIRAATIATSTIDVFWTRWTTWKDKQEHEARTPPPPSIVSISFANMTGLLIGSGLLWLVSICTTLMVPICLQQLLVISTLRDLPEGLNDGSAARNYVIDNLTGGMGNFFQNGYTAGGVLFAITIVGTLAGRTSDQMLRTLALNVRTALIGAVHRKALYISPATAAVYPNGTIMTMVNVDSEAVFAAIQLGHQIWSIPLQIIATIALLSRILGASVWVGVGALAGSVLFLALAVPIIAMASPRILRLNDQRLGLLREVLMGISLVKINSWEPVLHARIRAIRLLQIVQLRRFNVGIVIFVIVAQFAGTIMPVAAFSVYSIKNAAVPAAIVFPALCFFNALVSPLIATPQVLSGLIRAKFSLARIQAFLLAVETAEPISEPPAATADGASNDPQAPSTATVQYNPFVVKDASYTWRVVNAADDSDNAAASTSIGGGSLKKAKLASSIRSSTSAARAAHSDDAAALFTVSRRASSVTIIPNAEGPEALSVLEQQAIDASKALLASSQPTDGDLGNSDAQYDEAGNSFEMAHLERSSSVKNSSGSEPSEHGNENDSGSSNTPTLQGENSEELQNHHALSEKDGAAPSSHALRNINLVVPKGSLTVIVGRCGSGKSSLLAALTGQMQCVTGKTYTAPNLRVACCTQQPWMQQCSIKDNILFGLDLHPQRLKEALRVSSLDRDIEGFPRGIDEMVGESGVNLSGGQKSRVALARAVYSHADAYILDDPLSSLDISVCSAVFEDCIMQKLKGQTRVMVMSQMHLIKYADQLLVMKDGMIVQAGTYDELCAVDGELKDLIGATKQESSAVVAAGPDAAGGAVAIIASPAAAAAAGEETGSTDIIAEEESASGAVKWATYVKFYKACGGAWRMAFLLGVLVLYEAGIVITSQWLAWWSASQWDNPAGWWIARYQAIVWSSLVLLTALNLTILTCVIRASASLHEAALKGVLDAPLWWFESQTIGRIINRFSRDIDAVDQRMLAEIYQFVAGAGGLLAIAVTLAYSVPWLLCILVPMCVVYWYILRFYRATIRELKRIESTQRTPLYSFISENLGGIATIRAYGRRMDFVRKGLRLLDDSNTPSYLRFCADIWVTLRIELLASGVLFAVAMLGNTDAIKSSLLGLALTYAVALTYTCNLLLKSMANMEAELNAVERLSIYADALPRDAPPTFPTDAPEDAWPTLGHVEINNVTVVYPSRPDHPILRDLTLEIKPGKRVCIAGRTGSGKSTLLSAFLRLLECRTGTILLDGVDVARVGTRALRRGINMVPQEPFLFAGTVRECLDIEGLHTDAELWSALQQVGLDAFISAQPDKLSARVEPGGENLSHGQRVLLSLARAVLAKPKVILLDESTGAMDAASERFVRRALREHFAGVTLISVVHRLHDAQALAEQYDCVLLMEDGVIAEWEDLDTLMANPESKFRRLVEASGRALKDD
ncbi:hypothetical protein HDU88_004781 [Geranomyces variabilis]|nr:hypothetical protein HDU88_004781 [Geranomyces variabilis]